MRVCVKVQHDQRDQESNLYVVGSPARRQHNHSFMANTTVAGALAIHGKNPQVRFIFSMFIFRANYPQFLVETVIRNRIYESNYWKEHCFALTGRSFWFLFLRLLTSPQPRA